MKNYNNNLKNSVKTNAKGFTLIELMIAVAIVGILASIAVPNFIKYREKARVAMAITEIRLIEKEIVNYLIDYGELPGDLSELGMDTIRDPWGRPYEYLRIQGSDEAQDDKGKKDDKGKNESYLACFRWIFMGPKFLFPGFNIAFIQLVEFKKIFPQVIIPSLLAKKDKDDKDKKDKDDKDDKSKKGKPRKDHQLHPINTDYDLYSVGKDGKSTETLASNISKDDIIRANDGGYVGLVSNY
jgi:general secretion pathway protein G